MMTIRRSEERGPAEFGWLSSKHSFSFGEYYDPEHMGFGDLRVINEDRVAPGAGFPMHGHKDMEIVTYVLEGALEHRDSMGNGEVMRPGDVQHMTAGTGVRHSEFNPSQAEPVHLLQIWILPDARDHEPGYQQRHFPPEDRLNRLRLVASGDGRDGSLKIHQDADILAALIEPGQTVRHDPATGRKLWLQVARGAVEVAGERLAQGDAAAIEEVGEIAVTATGEEVAEVLLFDLRGDGDGLH